MREPEPEMIEGERPRDARPRRATRRWDILGAGLGVAIAVIDLAVFAWAGLAVGELTRDPTGWLVLGGFVVGYGALGFAGGRLWMAGGRIRRQLRALEEGRARLA